MEASESDIVKTNGIDKTTVVTCIEQFMTVLKVSLAYGENVGFDSFIVKQRAENTALNISKNISYARLNISRRSNPPIFSKSKSQKKMKLSPKLKKAISTSLIFLLMLGLYGIIVSLCNQYIREHNMLTKPTKFVLFVFMSAGFYFIYKWFSKRIDTIQKRND